MQRLRHCSGFGGVSSRMTSKEAGSETTKYVGIELCIWIQDEAHIWGNSLALKFLS